MAAFPFLCQSSFFPLLGQMARKLVNMAFTLTRVGFSASLFKKGKEGGRRIMKVGQVSRVALFQSHLKTKFKSFLCCSLFEFLEEVCFGSFRCRDRKCAPSESLRAKLSAVLNLTISKSMHVLLAFKWTLFFRAHTTGKKFPF